MQIEAFLKLQNRILKTLTAGVGFPGIAREASSILGRAVFITNTAYRVLGTAGSKDIIEGNLLNVVEFDEQSSFCRMMKGEVHAEVLEGSIYRVVGQNQKLQGFLFLLSEPKPQPSKTISIEIHESSEHHLTLEEEHSLIQQICLLCAVEFTKNNLVLRAQQEYKDAFIYDLLYSNLDSVKDILSRGEIWGWDFNRPHAVAVFEISDFQDFTSDQHLSDIISQRVESSLNEWVDQPILMKKRGQLICILPTENIKSVHEARVKLQNGMEKTLNIVIARVGKRQLGVGIGRVYASPIDLFRSFQEAKVALELGRLMKDESGITFFSDLGLARILYHHDQQQLREFYEETLGELIQSDQEGESSLLMTLEEYLKHQCDLKKTAQSLYLHPNTLRYRLKKIEEILSVPLDDFDTKLNLMTAFKIKYLKKV